MHTYVLLSYTTECALLLVTSMTTLSSEKIPLTAATRRVPSGDHATSRTLHDGQNKKESKENKKMRTKLSHCTVYTFSCVAILVMQSDLSQLPDATKVPSGEIAHTTCDPSV